MVVMVLETFWVLVAVLVTIDGVRGRWGADKKWGWRAFPQSWKGGDGGSGGSTEDVILTHTLPHIQRTTEGW